MSLNDKHQDVETPTGVTTTPIRTATNSRGEGISATKLFVLLVLSSIYPLYHDLLPNAVDEHQLEHQLEQQQQTTLTTSTPSESLKSRSYPFKTQLSNIYLNRDPLIIYLEDFLQPGSEHIIELAQPIMTAHGLLQCTAYLEPSHDDVIRCIEERASLFSNISMEATEPLQVVWYTKGQEFGHHVDYYPREHLKDSEWSQFGQRYTTFLVYLNEPAEGGSTMFSLLDFELEPKKNAAVFWYNVDITETEDFRTLHSGMPVNDGEKYALNIWQRKMIPGIEEFIQEAQEDDEEDEGNKEEEHV
ncbi:hypothetical protein BDF22DRAFT_667433 [Syncephalis plumigaleata]|nr:hypothetical protein BDF22DRAFT_667433 [Syncephalis plumigaleata]